MEDINTNAQNIQRAITWNEIKTLLKDFDKSKKYYGVPRGGAYISAMLNPVDNPEEADIIIDDIIDSGATKKKFEKYNKPFIALFDKQKNPNLGWIQFPWENEGAIEIEENVARVIEYFDSINREGLKETPKRYIKFLKEFLNPPVFNFTTFESEGYDQMIIVQDIPFYSLCEHHLAPFFGVGHIAYIPNNKIVGISKLPRTLELYSRQFQNQERITKQVAQRLMEELNPKGVAVVLEAEHLCMAMRGVKKPNCKTITSELIGAFKNDLNCRNEFMNLIK